MTRSFGYSDPFNLKISAIDVDLLKTIIKRKTEVSKFGKESDSTRKDNLRPAKINPGSDPKENLEDISDISLKMFEMFRHANKTWTDFIKKMPK